MKRQRFTLMLCWKVSGRWVDFPIKFRTTDAAYKTGIRLLREGFAQSWKVV